MRQDILRNARKLYDMRSILGLNSRQSVIVCPLPFHAHAHNTPSFSVYARNGIQRFHCHGSCGIDGDVIDLVGYLKIPGYDPTKKEHVLRAVALLEAGERISPPRLAKPRINVLPNDLWKDFLPAKSEVIEYAEGRGLKLSTLHKFGVGQYTTSNVFEFGVASTWMTIPTFTGGRLTKIKLRNIFADGKEDRYRAYPGSMAGLFNLNNVFGRTDPVLIVKGEISAMLLDQYGVLACAPNAGEANNEKEMRLAVAFCRKRIVVGDNDPEPIMRQTLERLRERAAFFKAEIKMPPQEFHDIDDWILADPDAAIFTIKEWMRWQP